ncbi:MAG: hypothetical protein IPF98_21660 [Gemmatimonadetes bacterium]|nr:hypothetical protein [Gemmatimonadota bacterium]MCC6774155.1 hypothetical protein [Gemmatimonadaceae bacterium]
MTHPLRLPLLMVVLAATSACASRSGSSGNDTVAGSPDAATATMDAPRLAQLRPDTIALGRGEVPTMVLTGSGFIPGATGAFATGANRVRVGRATIEGVAADSSGTVLRFPLPLSYTDTTARGRPSSFTPGQYPVSVVTPRGTSNSLTLTMIP